MALSIHVMTLFPAMFEGFLNQGIISRGLDANLLDVNVHNIRDAAKDRHRTVDDIPYGGGAGMVMKADVLADCLESTEPFESGRNVPVCFLTPQGRTFSQTDANRMSLLDEFVLICGRYRGIDERFRERFVTDEISIGDFVLSGGEPAAMVVIDAVARLVPGVMGDFESGIDDSFQNGLLDCPWYTRPDDFRGMKVPEVLKSGNHAKIKEWRNKKSMARTRERRPDLLG